MMFHILTKVILNRIFALNGGNNDGTTNFLKKFEFEVYK